MAGKKPYYKIPKMNVSDEIDTFIEEINPKLHYAEFVRHGLLEIYLIFNPEKVYTEHFSERGRANPYRPRVPVDLPYDNIDYFDEMSIYVYRNSFEYLMVISNENEFKNGIIKMCCSPMKENYKECYVVKGLEYLIYDFLPNISKQNQGEARRHSTR